MIFNIFNLFLQVNKIDVYFKNIIFYLFLSIIYNLGNAQIDYNPNTGYVVADSVYNDTIIIQSIEVRNNKYTPSYILIREISQKKEDTLFKQNLIEELDWIKNRIYNIGIFLFVDLDLILIDKNNYKLIIDVKEKIKILPLPIGGLADRNFNEWWIDRNHDIRRLDIGLDIKFRYLRKKNELLRIKAVVGFNEKFELFYSFPYINKKLKWGLQTHFLVGLNRQIAYESYQHKLHYFEHDHYALQRYWIKLNFFNRKHFYNTHNIQPYIQKSILADTITRLNNNYFHDSSTHQNIIGINYTFSHEKKDFIKYPLIGKHIKIITETGLAGYHSTYQNISFLKFDFALFQPINNRLFYANGFKMKTSYPINQPYFSQRGLGYQKEFLSGYELYVIDGQHYFLQKSHYKLKVIDLNPKVRLLKKTKLRTVPLQTYLKLHHDFGYVVDQTNNLNNNFLTNRLLYSAGIGLDFVSYFGFVGRLEYSINDLKEKGFFIHINAGL